MTATLRYELHMQLRRPALWTVSAITLVLVVLALVPDTVGDLLHAPARTAMVRVTVFCDVPMPIGYAFLLADRLVRDDHLDVAALLDATPASRWRRLVGKYLGGVIATALPMALVHVGFAITHVVANSSPAALAWAAATFGAITLPALLFVGAAALACPLVAPLAVFRVLFLGYWLWSSYLVPPQLVPTLNQTVLGPVGGYAIQVFFGYHGPHAGGTTSWAGPVPGALLNALRPTPTTATACLSVVTLLVLAALVLAAGHLLRERRTR